MQKALIPNPVCNSVNHQENSLETPICFFLLYENILIIFTAYFSGMPRPKRTRRVARPPGFQGYKPYGNRHGNRDDVDLLYEEYEAIKLADYDLMNHQEAAVHMGISRPTFARIYESARQKIARALVETRRIRSVCGNARFDQSWYVCNDCHARFTIPRPQEQDHCPICKKDNLNSIITIQ